MMRLRAVFRVQVAGSTGVLIETLSAVQPFDAVAQGAVVRIVPEAVARTERDSDADHAWEYEIFYLLGLRAEVELDSESTELTPERYWRFRAPAAEALERTLTQLRAVTGDPAIDTKLTTMELTEYLDEAGCEISPRFPEWLLEKGLMLGTVIGELTAEGWQKVAANVTNLRGTSLHREWLLDARSYLDTRNFTMPSITLVKSCASSSRLEWGVRDYSFV